MSGDEREPALFAGEDREEQDADGALWADGNGFALVDWSGEAGGDSGKGEEEGRSLEALKEAFSESRKEDFAQQGQALKASMAQAAAAEPEEEAKIRALARAFDAPPEMARRYREQFEAQARNERLEALFSAYPKTAEYLSEPDHARLAHDDVENMTALEAMFAQPEGFSIAGDFGARADKARIAPLDFAVDAARNLAAGAVGGAIKTAGSTASFLARSLPMLGVDPEGEPYYPEALTKGEPVDWYEEAEKAGKMLAAASGADALYRFGKRTEEAIAGEGMGEYGLVGRSLLSGFRSLGNMLPAAAASFAAGGPALSLAFAGLSEGGEAFMDDVLAGKRLGPATVHGMANGGIEAATEFLPMSRLIKEAAAGTPFVSLFLRNWARETPSELVATAGQTLSDRIAGMEEGEDAGDVFLKWLEELPENELETAISVIPMSLGFSGAARVQQIGAARALKKTVERFNRLAGESRLRSRSPEDYAAMAGFLASGSGVTHAYIDAGKWIGYFQEKGMDPKAAAEQYGALNYGEAAELGVSLMIPFGRYQAGFSGSEHAAAFTAATKFDEKALTAEEGEERKARSAPNTALLAGMLHELGEESKTAGALGKAVEQLTDEVAGQLALRFGGEDARTQASILARAFVHPVFRELMARAEEAGKKVSPEEVVADIRRHFEGYGLVVEANAHAAEAAQQYGQPVTQGFHWEYGQREGLFDLPAVPITRISGREFGEGREAIQAGAMAHLNKVRSGAPIRNRDTGWALKISRDDWSKIAKNKDQTTETLQAVFAIEQLAENAVLAESHEDKKYHNPDMQGVHRMYAPLEINGVLYRAKLTVRDYTGVSSGERTRLHAIETIEIEKPGGAIALTNPSETAKTGTPTGLSSSVPEAQSGERANLHAIDTVETERRPDVGPLSSASIDDNTGKITLPSGRLNLSIPEAQSGERANLHAIDTVETERRPDVGSLNRAPISDSTGKITLPSGRLNLSIPEAQSGESAPLGTLLTQLDTPTRTAQPTTERTLSISEILAGSSRHDGTPWDTSKAEETRQGEEHDREDTRTEPETSRADAHERRGFTEAANPGAAEQAEANRQYDEVVAQYRGTDQWMKAPNGKPTNLSERQWVQARTANFKRWLGFDWERESEAQGFLRALQDHAGNLERAERQSGSADSGLLSALSQMDTFVHQVRSSLSGRDDGGTRELHKSAGRAFGRLAQLDPETGEPQIYYHGSKADIRAFDPNHPNKKDNGWLGKGIYLTSSEGIADIYSRNKKGEAGRNIMPLFARLKNPYIASMEEKAVLGIRTEGQAKERTAELIRQGYDGIIAYNFNEPDWIETKEVVVFAPEQVKSAIGNAGTFSESPLILYQRQGPVPVSETGDSRIGIEEARQTAKELAAEYGNAPELVVVEKPADLPFDAPDNARGAYWRGRCFLVASNLDTAEDARMTFAHEVIGHYGLNGFFGEAIHVALGDIFLHNTNVRKAAKKWIKDNADYIRAVRESRKDWSRERFTQWRRNIATEEALAQMAQRGEKITGARKLVYAIQELLRAIGLWQLANRLEAQTDAEALMALHKAELFVRSGKNINTATVTDVYALFARHDRKAADGGRIGIEEVRQLAAELASEYGNAPELVVVEKPADLPFDAPEDAKGAYRLGKCYLVSVNIHTAEDAKGTFSHEVIGHYGLNGFFGDRLSLELDNILFHNKNVQEAAQKWIKDNADYIRAVRESRKDWSRKRFTQWRRNIATEEALAQMAQRGEKITGARKLVYAIQKLLRAIGLEQLAGSLEAQTDAEALMALHKAELFVRSGKNINTATVTDVYARFARHDRKAIYQRQVDELASGERQAASLGRPSRALLDSGIADVSLVITRDVVDKVEEKHGISLAQLKALPDLLEHPVMVFKSATDGGHVVVLNDTAIAEDGKTMPLIVAIRPNGRITVNYIRSVYARRNFPNAVKRWAKAGLLVAAQKKAAIDLIDLYSQRGKTSEADRMINNGRVRSLPESVPLRRQGDDFVAFSRKGNGQALQGSAQKETAVDLVTPFSPQGETSGAGHADLYSQRGETSAAGRAINSGKSKSLTESVPLRKQGDDFIDFFQEDDGQAGSLGPEGDSALDEDARILHQFIGEKGAAELDRAEEATVRLDNLAVAREMEAAGRQAKVIKLATGWERGADGKWRYEISDAFLRLDLPEKGEKRLGEVLVHPELFMAYPDLKGLLVVREPILSPAGAAAFLDGDTIFVDRDLSPRETASALLHEVQHAIQEREGFARGAAPDTFETDEKGLVDTGRDRRRYVKPDMAYKAVAGEVEARNAQRRAFMTPEQRMYLLARETEDVARKDQIFLQQALSSDGLAAGEAYEKRGYTEAANPGAAEQAEANRQYDEIVAKYKDGPLWLKAPNGEPTKLTERQWVQARTANFKAVFGDWEKASQKRFLEGNVVTSVDSGQFRTTDGTKPSVKVLEYFASIGNKATNSVIGDVMLDERSVRLGIAHKTALDSYAVAKDVIEKGVIIDYDNNHKGNGSEGAVIAAPVKIGNKNFIGYVVARKSGNENRFYAAGITLRENLQQGAQKTSSSADGQAAVEISGYPAAEVRSRKSDIRILLNAIYSVNLSISNAVDKNGEPAVSWWQEREAYKRRGYTEAANPGAAEQAEANRQYDEIAAKYKNSPLWLKAPNGEPTKLTEQQWVQARTANFKAVFGDWEKAGIRERLEAQVPVEVADDYKISSHKERKAKAVELLDAEISVQKNVGLVKVSKSGIRKSFAHSTSDAKLDVIPKIREILEQATYLDTLQDFTGKEIQNHYFATRIAHGGQIKLVFLRVRKMPGTENQLYVHDVFVEEEIKAKAGTPLQIRAYGEEAVRNLRGTSLYKSILQEIYNTVNLSISNAVDKNGEPAVSWWQERGDAGKGQFLSEALRHEQKVFTESDWPAAEEKLKQDVQDWGKRVDLVESRKRKPSAPVLMLRQTPLVMHLLGADFREVYAAPHLFDGLLPEERTGSTHNVHPNMTAEILRQLPAALADPVAVFRSATREGRFVFMLDVRDANGATVVVPVELNAKKDLTAVVHMATSAYSKDSNGIPNNAWFAKQAKENALYINRQKEKRWTETSSGSNSLWVKSSASRDNKLSSEKRILTEEDLVKLKQKYPSYYQYEQQGKTRGALVISPERRMRISLFKDADYSTFVHETAHFMLEVYRDLANAPGASAYIRKEYAAILRYLGAKPGQPITRRQHERFARAFERYLMEGKAPSAALRGVFSRFRDWLLDIYRYFIRLDVALSDDIRAVFDRMLATDGEIAFMRQAREMEPLFASARVMGADAAAFAAYEEKSRLEWEAAEDALRACAMRQRLYEGTREYRKAYERMRQGAADAYDAQPAAKALYALTAHEGFSLNAARLRQVYGEDFLSLLPVVAGRRIYGEQGDLLLEDAAGALGFDSGDAMIRAIARLPEREAFIRKEARRRMLEEEARGLRGETLAASLEESLGNAHRLERLKAELGFLAQLDKSGQALPEGAISAQFAAMQQEAVEVVSGRQVGNLKPSLYFQAMQAAARKARGAIERPRPNYGEAIRQKRAELMNLLLFKEASRVLLAVEDGVAQAQAVAARPFEEAVRTRDAFCVVKAKWLAARLHLGGDADALLADMRSMKAGRQAVDEAFLDDAAAGPVEEMTASAALDALGAVQAFWKLARRLQVMAVDGRRVALSRAAGAVAVRLRQAGRSGKVMLPAVSAADGVMAALGGLRWHEARMSSFCRLADDLMAGESAGPLARYVFEPLKKAADKARQVQDEALGRLDEALAGFGFVRETIAAPELGMTFGKATGYGKAELVHALLYMGCVSGLQRLVAGYGRGGFIDGRPDTRRWAAFLSRMAAEGRLTREDYDRVQAIWDVFAGLTPRWQQAHEALFGRVFDGAAARPFVAFGKAYRGGFVPVPDMGGGSAGGQGVPLVLDLTALRSQLGEMAIFAWAAPVGRDVSRLLEQKAVQAAFGQVAPGWLDGVVKPWLACCMQPYAAFAGEGLTVLEGWAGVGRLRAGVAALLDAGAEALMQQGMGAAVFERVKPSYVAAAFQRMAKDRAKAARAVTAASSYMQSRLRADWAAFYEGFGPDGSISDAGLPALAADMFCAPVIWAAAYYQALAEEGLAHAAAVSLADGVVQQALGADAARRGVVWQDGGAFATAVALFQAYFAGQAQGSMVGEQAAAAVLLLQSVMLPVWSGAALCRAGGDAVEGKAFGRWLKDAFGWGAMDGEGLSLAGRALPGAGEGRQPAALGRVFYPPFVGLTDAACRAMAWVGPDGVFDSARFAQDMAAFWKTACGLPDVADGTADDGDDVARFSRGGEAGSRIGIREVSIGENEDKAQANAGMSVDAVRAIAREFSMTFRNAPEIIVTESPFDFSPDAMPDGTGLFDPGTGKCWLFSRNLRDADDATATLAHEVIAHYGLRGFFGDSLGDVLVAIRDHNPKVEALSQIWWKNNQDYINQVRRQEGKNWTEGEFEKWQRDIAIEEAMAQLAEKGEKITGVKRLVVWIQRALRQLGWRWAENLANWLESKTDAEVLYALYKAELFVRGDISALTTATKENLSKYCVREGENSEEEGEIARFARGGKCAETS